MLGLHAIAFFRSLAAQRANERRMCRTYGASEDFGRTYPALPRWANLFRAYGADEFARWQANESNIVG
jgi:hypothetical protein